MTPSAAQRSDGSTNDQMARTGQTANPTDALFAEKLIRIIGGCAERRGKELKRQGTTRCPGRRRTAFRSIAKITADDESG